ncbi:hypothetical protein [Puniceicoccus vermicola]|uniref:Uncharacterized protein n=1 Tax=Puniceicoccus vermicola TaxID=388746 RepID=A0A7X1B069_9BACT|nr:hypothetical protein [Puniceicoccus vermicola]
MDEHPRTRIQRKSQPVAPDNGDKSPRLSLALCRRIMKLFFLSFSPLMLFWGLQLLKQPVHYDGRYGPQEAYQSIPAAIVLIGCALAFIISSKPHKNLRFPKTEKERKERMLRLLWCLAVLIGLTLLFAFIVPGDYDSVTELRELKNIPQAALTSFLGLGSFFIPAFIFAYLLKEI